MSSDSEDDIEVIEAEPVEVGKLRTPRPLSSLTVGPRGPKEPVTYVKEQMEARTRGGARPGAGQPRGPALLRNNPGLMPQLVEAIRKGATPTAAGKAAGLSHGLVQRWIDYGQEELAAYERGELKKSQLTEYSEFAMAVAKARSELENEVAGALIKHATTPFLTDDEGRIKVNGQSVKAAQWWLERSDPERYGQQVQVKVTQQVEQELEQAIARLEEEFAGEPRTLERILRVMAGE